MISTAAAAALALPLLGTSAAGAGPEPVNVDARATEAQRSSRPADDPRTVDGGLRGALGQGAASSGLADCPLTYACAWVDADYGGPRAQWAGNNASWGVFSQPACQTGSWKNCASSARNNGTQCSVTFYRGIGYGPGGTLFRIGSSSPWLGNQGANDDYESNAWC